MQTEEKKQSKSDQVESWRELKPKPQAKDTFASDFDVFHGTEQRQPDRKGKEESKRTKGVSFLNNDSDYSSEDQENNEDFQD